MRADPEAVLRRIEWTVVRRLDGLLQGDYRTLFHGHGLDLAEVREYQVGDDVRTMDWNVTARTGVPHVRQYLEEREITAWFLLDLSPSVDFGTARALKRTMLVDLVAILARLLTRGANRFGAVLSSGETERVVPAGTGRQQVLQLVRALQEAPRLRRAPLTDLGGLLAKADRTIRRRSLVVVVSDFISVPGWNAPLAALSRRHEVLAVRLVDPAERELPDIGAVLMEDAETGEQLFVDTHDAGFRRRFADAGRCREAELAAVFRRCGVDCLVHSTSDDPVLSLLAFATMRRRRRALAAPRALEAPRALAGSPAAP